MSDNIDFQQGSDSGEADVPSISPVKNGDPADASSFNRPVESLRHRTEVLRAEANSNRWVRDADRAALAWLESGATLTWDDALKKLTLAGGSLFVAPAVGPGSTREAALEFNGATFPSRRANAELVFSNGVTMRVRSQKFQHGGANEISIRFVESEDLATGMEISVEGTSGVDPATQPGRDDIVVSFGHTNPSTYAQAVLDLNNHPLAQALVEVDITSGDDSLPVVDMARTYLEGGLDGVFHQIPPSAFSANMDLEEGDCLALWYDTVKLRRESIEETNNHLMTTSNVVNLSVYPEKAQNAIPLGRVLNGKFVFFNGTTLMPGEETTSMDFVNAKQVAVDGSGWTTVTDAPDLHAGLTNIDTSVTSLTQRVDDHDTDISGLDGRITYLEDRSSFTSLPDLINTLSVGEVGVLIPAVTTTTKTDFIPWTTEIRATDTDGKYLYFVDEDTGDLRLWAYDLEAQQIATPGGDPVFEAAGVAVGQPVRLAVNGKYVCMQYETSVGNPVISVFGDDVNSAFQTPFVLDLTTEVPDTTRCMGIALAGDRVFAAVDAGALTDGDYYAYVFNTGSGGPGGGISYTKAVTGFQANIVTNGSLVLGYSSGTGTEVLDMELVPLSTASLGYVYPACASPSTVFFDDLNASTKAFPLSPTLELADNGEVTVLRGTNKGMPVAIDSEPVIAHIPKLVSGADRHVLIGFSTSGESPVVAYSSYADELDGDYDAATVSTDGQNVYFAGPATGGGFGIWKITKAMPPKLWRRLDPGDNQSWTRTLAAPV